MTLELTPEQKTSLVVLLNCELRVETGGGSHPLNEIFRQLAGRDHDVYARHHPTRRKPNEAWYGEAAK